MKKTNDKFQKIENNMKFEKVDLLSITALVKNYTLEQIMSA